MPILLVRVLVKSFSHPGNSGPINATILSFSELARANRYLESGQPIGKESDSLRDRMGKNISALRTMSEVVEFEFGVDGGDCPWQEDGEEWRPLKAIFPDSFPSHTREQITYFGPDGLVRRHEYGRCSWRLTGAELRIRLSGG
jgi:hypothetical protein